MKTNRDKTDSGKSPLGTDVATEQTLATSALQAVGKFQLCQELSWARTTLDRRLESDAAFPVLARGGKDGTKGGWKFDVAAVRAYLAGAPTGKVAGEAESAGTRTAGEQSARQRRDAIQADILQDQLNRNRGELVRVEEMRQALTLMLAHLGQGLGRLPDQIIERLGLPEEKGDDIRQLIDELRRAMVDELGTLLVRPTQ